jgi:hypothetical protein
LYIGADDLEETILRRTREVLSNTDVILGKLGETSDKASLNSLDTKIRGLENTLQNYERRRSNILKATELGEFEQDEILDRLNNIKRLRCENEIPLNDLMKTKDYLTSLANAKVKLGE